MMNDVPCKGCLKRYPACHDECELYKRFKELNQQKKETEEEYYKRYGVANFRHYRNRWHSV